MKITLCVICKDEEKKIVRCIQSVKEAVDDILVVDTGSKDRTVELAKEQGATVYEIPWEDSFSKARNYAINKIKEGWIIFIDADEYFPDSSIPHIRSSIEDAARHQKDCVLVEIINVNNKGLMGTFKCTRAFRKDQHIYYIHDIHEMLYKDNGILQEWDASDKLKLLHDGYEKEVVEGKDKTQRNERMLLKELEKNPKNVDAKFYLLQNYLCQNNVDKVLEYGKIILQDTGHHIEGVKELTYAYLLDACMVSMQPYETTSMYYERGIKINKEYPDFDYFYGLYLFKLKEYEACVKVLESCLDKCGKYKGSITSYALAEIEEILIYQINSLLAMKRYPEAVNLMVKVLRLNPERTSVLYNLLLIIQQQETAEAIGQFLCKLYDLKNIKHQIILVQVAKQSGNEALYKYFYNQVSDELKQQLQ